ncbi:TPA: reverse transcriptase family protein [Vibrio parahaemolyticus]|nr:RNA-directed DNA polymerase [Vibrio parahaemolyticus]EJG1063516.1 RNA-directed DNA polymerase [Vibrio parahaemolyticus O1]ELI5445419.1 RNA-directed DNA polymerase [Vibrio parahaemolyticus]MBM4923813.1 RNA-directed DNA polymerase [Vibrio parahaemolyticus]
MTRKSKLKLETKNKSYPLQDSPFHKLTSKKVLRKLLDVDADKLKKLRQDKGNYSEFDDIGESGKARKIQKPARDLDIVHTRIASLLCRISTPQYLHSGKKQHSNITNARQHQNKYPLLATDVKSFFPSTTWDMVFSFFYSVMKCSSDVSEILADLCTCHKHIPTGSRISMPLAFWANIRMFSELEALSTKHNVTMTVYVDDLTFSGKQVNKLFRSSAKKIITKHGHIMHPTKTKLYKSNQAKLVTGVVVEGESIKVRNEQHRKMHEELGVWFEIKDMPYAMSSSITSKLLGRLHAMGTIDDKFKQKAKTVKKSTTS